MYNNNCRDSEINDPQTGRSSGFAIIVFAATDAIDKKSQSVENL